MVAALYCILMGTMRLKQTGFTIVELLIVVVVIAILAAITIVAYSGISQRARDAERLEEITAVMKALEVYKSKNGVYPTAVGNSAGGWEVSSNPNANHVFLQQLVDDGDISRAPVDPINTGDMNTTGAKIYAYYRYPAGTNGCASAFYVLLVRTGEASGTSSASPGGTCGTNSPSAWWYKLQQDL